MTNWSIWRKKNFFWPPNDELWNMTKKNLFSPLNDEFKYPYDEKNTFLDIPMTNCGIWRKKTFLDLPMTNCTYVVYDDTRPFYRSILTQVKFYGYQALQPFNPRHRACLPEQSLKAYNLTVKRRKIRKNKQFHGNFKAYNF